MNSVIIAIRHVLATTDTARAEAIVKSFRLLEDEEDCIIRHEIRGESIVEIALSLAISPETVKRRRRSGLLKMADALLI